VSHTPPTSELFPARQLIARHAHLLNEHRVAWALRQRRRNGLAKAGAIYESPCGELLIHEPAFLEWFLGLNGRGKPRRLRRTSLSRAGSTAPAP
jgi:hypothetical protein